MRDFTLRTYELLCRELKKQGYRSITFADYCEVEKSGKYVILRHDVDKDPRSALEMALLENHLTIKATYYFRTVDVSYDENIIVKIGNLDHEIGYHYEDFSAACGDPIPAIEGFKSNLSKLRQLFPVKTVCMHGSPLSKWDNRAIWGFFDYRKFGIIGEPYLDTDFSTVLYLTDTGRTWNGADYSIRDKINQNVCCSFRSTSDIIKALRGGKLPPQMMLTVHPQRWHDALIPWTKELIWQRVKNVFKKNFLVKE